MLVAPNESGFELREGLPYPLPVEIRERVWEKERTGFVFVGEPGIELEQKLLPISKIHLVDSSIVGEFDGPWVQQEY